jgi:hypothetical protein
LIHKITPLSETLLGQDIGGQIAKRFETKISESRGLKRKSRTTQGPISVVPVKTEGGAPEETGAVLGFTGFAKNKFPEF